MSKRSFTLLDLTDDPRRDVSIGDIELGPEETDLPGSRIEKQTLRGGLRDGIELLNVEVGQSRVALLPQRGMGIWKASLAGVPLGWQSPVRGPVHPKFVPITDPSGLGWLDGFDELLCRCGLYSNGAPERNERGHLLLPLHGRIANTPAHRVTVETDSELGEVAVTGVVDECRFNFQKLRLASTVRIRGGASSIRIIDEVTNLSGNPGEMQLLYHINFGPPLLGPGAQVVAPIRQIMPRNKHSSAGMSDWNRYTEPRAGNEEEAFFCMLLGDSQRRTQALLRNAAGTTGVSLRFRTDQLPYFTLWKNCAAREDGFVTGLEPGINFPNARSFEAAHGRVRKLAPGETARFELELIAHPDEASVAAAEREINKLQAAATLQISMTPQPDWTSDG